MSTPCKGCGAPIDCPGTDDFIYTLTADPRLPYFFLCPPPNTCRPAPGPNNEVTSSEIFLDCCGHHLTGTIYSNSTTAEVSAAVADLVNRCIAFSGECNPPKNPIMPPGPDPQPVYLNGPTRCVAFCPDGTQFNYTVPAGTTFGSSQLAADSAAAQLCIPRARANILCLGDIFEVACVGDEIFEPIEASSANTPLVMVVTSGTIPTGLAFFQGDDLTAYLIGTLQSPGGSFTFTVKATDKLGQSVSKSYTVCVSEILPSSGVLAPGVESAPYSDTISGNACVPAANEWYITSGTLPPGLTLDTLTGVVSGTPTAFGVYTFEVTSQEHQAVVTIQSRLPTFPTVTFDCSEMTVGWNYQISANSSTAGLIHLVPTFTATAASMVVTYGAGGLGVITSPTIAHIP